VQRLGVLTRCGPHQPAGVMIDHHGQVPMPLLVGDLVDTDPAQPVVPVGQPAAIGPHPRHDRTHRAPADPHQLAHRRLGRVHRQPRHRGIEGPGMPRAVARPRHRRHHHPMRSTPHPRRLSLHHRPHRAHVQRPPPPPPRTAIKPGATPLAVRTPPSGTPAHPYLNHQQRLFVVELDTLDHRLLDSQQPSPYPCRTHAVLLPVQF
jgi:hypothetical protein